MGKHRKEDCGRQGTLFNVESKMTGTTVERKVTTVISFDQALKSRIQSNDKRLLQEVLEHARKIK